MKLLFVAADRMEFAGLAARASKVRRAALALDWVRTAELAGHEVMLAANGVGRNRAAAAVDAAVREFHPEALISTGFCGALEESLNIADIVVGCGIITEHGSYPTQALPHASSGPICSIDYIAQTAAQKASLRRRGAIAVEMEAAGVAERAQALQLPFYCVRSVTDLASEDMANDFNAALRPDGHFATMKILRRSFRHPAARLPELLRLKRRCARAAESLGEFFADSRF